MGVTLMGWINPLGVRRGARGECGFVAPMKQVAWDALRITLISRLHAFEVAPTSSSHNVGVTRSYLCKCEKYAWFGVLLSCVSTERLTNHTHTSENRYAACKPLWIILKN